MERFLSFCIKEVNCTLFLILSTSYFILLTSYFLLLTPYFLLPTLHGKNLFLLSGKYLVDLLEELVVEFLNFLLAVLLGIRINLFR